MMANRIGDWVQRLSQRVRERESRSFHNHESYITSAQPYFCEWSRLDMHWARPDIFFVYLCPWGLKGGAKVEIQKHRKNRPTAAKGRLFDAIVPHFEFRPATLSIKIESRCWVRGGSASRLPKAEMARHPRDL